MRSDLGRSSRRFCSKRCQRYSGFVRVGGRLGAANSSEDDELRACVHDVLEGYLLVEDAIFGYNVKVRNFLMGLISLPDFLDCNILLASA